MYEVVVLRDYFFDGQASLGNCIVYNNECDRVFKSVSLERGWVNNQNSISCIPEGIYDLELEYSPKFKQELWEIKGVQNRSECKFHVANYWWQLNGCIALGKYEDKLDNDPVMDVAASGITMERFHNALNGQTRAILKIFNVKNIT